MFFASASSPWSPWRHQAFRAIWTAGLVSNIGIWMQNVGAAWMMTSLTETVLMVALIQTASALPSFLLALPAGTAADLIDGPRQVRWPQRCLRCWWSRSRSVWPR